MGSKSRKPAPAADPASNRPVPAPAAGNDEAGEHSLDDRLDEALGESFPASDPPAVHRLTRGVSFLP